MRRAVALVCVAAFAALSASSVGARSDPAAPVDPFPEPPGLTPAVEFWVRVFSEWTASRVAVHDLDHPALVYEVVDLPGPVEERYTDTQRAWVDELRDNWTRYLERLEHKVATGEPLEEVDKQWALHFATVVGADKLAGASTRVRTQRGLRERFREGLARSGRFDAAIRRILREHDVPEDLAHLPHVESSFNYKARSSVGAAGIWQFTRGTGRLYMTINTAIDERLDPIIATRAAARYLRDAHAKLGTWPLAVTSYNHGVQGMQRAKERFGTDFERIVSEYDGKTFGFASKNFYAEFLAARRVAGDPARYFPEGLSPEPALDLDSVVLDERVTPHWLARHYDVPLSDLTTLNPSWTARAVADPQRLPSGTEVWLPRGTLDRLARRGGGASVAPPLAAGDGPTHVVRPGETLSGIARTHRVSVEALRAANGLDGRSLIRIGQKLRLPPGGARPSAPSRHVVQRGETLGRIASRYGVGLVDLVSANMLSLSSVIHPGQVLHIPH